MSLRRLAAFTTGVNLLVILWGAFVRASGSGAGCGRHWPLCNGVVVPRAASAATQIEFIHRVTSGLALLLVVALVVVIVRQTTAGHRLRKAGYWTLAFIIIEALVGAGLVLLELVGDDSSMLRAGYLAVHLANTFALLAALTITTLWADRPDPAPAPPVRAGTAPILWLLGLLLVAGATGAITALGDTLFPAGSLAEGLAQDRSPTAHLLLRLRIIHPAIAIVTAVVAALIVVRLLGHHPSAAVVLTARAVLVLIFAQLAIGVINLVLLVPIGTQLLHLLMADLVWMATVTLLIQLREPAPAG
jgi:cytochrome c oxidase assembly protein subunit 15